MLGARITGLRETSVILVSTTIDCGV